MSTKEALYDLVLRGAELQGEERLQATSKLARLMKIPPDQIEQVLEEKAGVIAQNLAPKTAREAYEKLLSVGIPCNLRPCSPSGLSLELRPLEAMAQREEASEAEKPGVGASVESEGTVACPACGHIHRFPAAQPAPQICEECQVVFAKFRKLTQETDETQDGDQNEKVRRALLTKHQRMVKSEREEREEREAQAQRTHLEEEIRKELGLPNIITSRTALIGSAAALVLLGMAMGVVGNFVYDLPHGGGTPTAPEDVQDPPRMGQAVPEADTLDPGMLAQIQVAATLASPPESAMATEPLTSPTEALAASASSPDSADSTATSAFLEGRWADLKTDTEWDLYILARIDGLLDHDSLPEAAALVDYLRDPERRFNRAARLAGQLWARNQSAEAEKLYVHLTAAAEMLADGGAARVAALCTVARRLNAAGRKAETETLLRKARNISETITSPAEKAAADTEIAALLSNLGRARDARTLFASALRGLGSIGDLVERISTVARFAHAYAIAGYRASALNLLESAARKSDALKNAAERTRTLGEIAEVAARLGDVPTALGTIQRMASDAAQDRTVYRIVAAEVASGRLGNAIDLADALKSPAYQALGLGLLGLRQLSPPSYRSVASASSERARKAADSVVNPAEKSAVTSEIGRFAARDGDMAAADRYFADADRLAESTSSAPDRDRALAILATSQARAQRFADARQKLARITDSDLGRAVAADLDNLQQAAKTVGL